MHELAITEGIMQAAIPEAEKAGAKRILEIRLKIGELSGVFPEYIQEYFSIVTKGTIAEDAKLIINRIPISISCRNCGYNGVIERKKIRCPDCGGTDFKIVSGREYYVDSLEVE